MVKYEHVKKLIEFANKDYPTRSWHVDVTFYQDGDFSIYLTSNWGKITDKFCYKKSIGKYFYHKYENMGQDIIKTIESKEFNE